MKTTYFLAAALLVAAPARADERAVIVTVKWDASGPSIDTVDRKEMPVPAQLGFPQLWSRFFELRDKDGDVHYAGSLVDPRARRKGNTGTSSFRVVLPDLDEAKHLVIIERVSTDPDTGRKVMLERDL